MIMMNGTIVKAILVKRQNLVKYVAENKEKIQDILREQRVHYSSAISKFLLTELPKAENEDEEVSLFKQSCDVEIGINIIDLGFEDYIIVEDFYDLFKDLIVEYLDTNEMDVNLDYQPIISKHKLEIDGELISAKDLYNGIISTGFKYPTRKLQLYSTKTSIYFIDKEVIEVMIKNLIKYDKKRRGRI